MEPHQRTRKKHLSAVHNFEKQTTTYYILGFYNKHE